MKNTFLILIFLGLFLMPTYGQDKLSKEEMAIQKVIEDETTHYMARDYDNWSKCYVQSPMTYISWMSPSANKNSLSMVQGWEDITKEIKTHFAAPGKIPNNIKKSAYQFKVTDNMAFVTFEENANPMQTRVLEKIDGQWKILRTEAVSSASFAKFRKLYDLQQFSGSWEVDMETVKEENGGEGWVLLHSEIEIKDVPSGIQGIDKSKFRTPNGELRTSEGLEIFTLDMQTNTVGAFNSVHYPQSNWSRAYQAQGDIDENGKLNMTGQEVGTTQKVNFSYWLEGDRLHFDLSVMQDGQKVYGQSYQMKRKGLKEEVKP